MLEEWYGKIRDSILSKMYLSNTLHIPLHTHHFSSEKLQR